MSEQALINPRIVSWARQRASLSEDLLAKKIGIKEPGKILEWENGEAKPTFKQAQNFATATNIPFGYLFLEDVPQEKALPIPDLRTIGSGAVEKFSFEIEDLIKQVVLKQEWYRDYLIKLDAPRLDFIGKFTIQDSILEVVQDIRSTIGVEIPSKGNWEDYYRNLIKGAENARIMVMRSGIVGNNTKRKLQVSEFRGFALSDEYAPVIFINSSDAPAARLFTLVHELAHLWIGKSGISDLTPSHLMEEKFCNAVAGEFLVPENEFLHLWKETKTLLGNLTEISTKFYVSKLVVAKKAFDSGVITSKDYKEYYLQELAKYKNSDGGGGNFYTNAKAKNSRLFSSAVVAEALSGRLLLRDAGNLLGVQPSKIKQYASELTV